MLYSRPPYVNLIFFFHLRSPSRIPYYIASSWPLKDMAFYLPVLASENLDRKTGQGYQTCLLASLMIKTGVLSFFEQGDFKKFFQVTLTCRQDYPDD